MSSLRLMAWTLRVSIGGAALLVGLGWASIEAGGVAVAGGGVVLGWGVWSATRQGRAASLWLAWGIGLTAGGAALGAPGWLALPAAGLLLAGWDLLRLRHRQTAAGLVENDARLTDLHLQWLAGAVAVGLAAGLAAASVQFGLRLEGAVALGLILALSLSAALRGIRQREAGPD